MARWDDWDTWEPTQDYPGAPPRESATLGTPPDLREPRQPEASGEKQAASFFDEFSQATREQESRTPGVEDLGGSGMAAVLEAAEAAERRLAEAREAKEEKSAGWQSLVSGWGTSSKPKKAAKPAAAGDSLPPVAPAGGTPATDAPPPPAASGGVTEVRMRRVGTPEPSAREQSWLNPVVAIAVLILTLLIGAGLGMIMGMNMVEPTQIVVTQEPSGPVNPEDQLDPSKTSPSPSKPSTTPNAAANPLKGMRIALDPGHNGGNAAAWQQITLQVPDGRGGTKECDTTGTATNDGYPEHEFNWDVVQRIKKSLEELGAKVSLTRENDTGVGPCVDVRGGFSEKVDADVYVSIHADGSTNTNLRGFFAMVAEPPVNPQVGAVSLDVAKHLVKAMEDAGFKAQTQWPGGIYKRSDLAGLNLQKRPAVMMEMGEMRNPDDAAMMKSSSGRQKYADAIVAGLQAWAEEKESSASPSPHASASNQGEHENRGEHEGADEGE